MRPVRHNKQNPQNIRIMHMFPPQDATTPQHMIHPTAAARSTGVTWQVKQKRTVPACLSASCARPAQSRLQNTFTGGVASSQRSSLMDACGPHSADGEIRCYTKPITYDSRLQPAFHGPHASCWDSIHRGAATSCSRHARRTVHTAVPTQPRAASLIPADEDRF